MMVSALWWAFACYISPSDARVTGHLYRELNNNAPPGVTYTIPRGSSSLMSIKTTTGSSNPYIQKLEPVHSGVRTNKRSVAAILGTHQRTVGGVGYTNVSTTNAYGTQYATESLWDGTKVKLLLDTGSSDTWAVAKSFQCIDYAGGHIPQDACSFGPSFVENFQYGRTEPASHMFIKYGDGEMVSGPMGFSDISVGNLTVSKQQVCLADSTYWLGNNVTSGLLGMAFPALTNAYLGDGSDHELGSAVQYSPFFTSLVEQGKIDPIFSLTIDRNSSTGMLALGGIAPATGLDYTREVTMDMIITNLIGTPAASYSYSFYTVIPDGWYYDHSTSTKKIPYIVDSGTTLCYLPPNLADAINAAYSPPGVYMWMYGAYFTDCNAISPLVAVILNGVKYYINPQDMLYRNMVDPISGLCMTGIASGGAGPYILGDVFMQNALSIFDIGQAKMRFIPRDKY
ncbi:aspartic peptidase domain-containing protein [Triangularia verruculosa]|uniref:Aspartic peptidase domain-containing protein n=1 Tax=Triangularia verruculosa TaxID=2587418 RepID=A0AAN7ASK0_9PEZI|nr:aspartic peptidase domain-containing protein [Triangularia verruculosa]